MVSMVLYKIYKQKYLKSLALETWNSIPQRKYEVEQYMAGKEEKTTTQRSYGVLDLFRSPNLCRKTIIVTFIW